MKKNQKIIIGIAAVLFVLYVIKNAPNKTTKSTSTSTTVVKKTTYTPVVNPTYVRAHYNSYKAKYY